MALRLCLRASASHRIPQGLRTRELQYFISAHRSSLQQYSTRASRGHDNSQKDYTRLRFGAAQIAPESSEHFYDYYFNFRIKPRPFQPAPWVTDLVRPPTPRREIFEVLQAPSVQLEDVRRALEDFIISSNTPDTITEKQKLYSQARPGTRALKWFLESGAHDVHDLSTHIRFRRALIHCLTGEDEIDTLWHWLAIPRVPEFARSWGLNEQGLWKGLVMLDVVNSTGYWSAEASRGLEAAVQCFCKGISVSRAAMDSQTSGIPLLAAGNWLESQVRGTHIRLSLPTFERFFAAQKVFTRDVDARRFHEASLILSHPTTPDALPMFKFFRKCSAMASNPSPFVRDLLQDKDVRALVPFYIIVRAAKMLHENGEQDKARWLLDFGRERLPSVFSRRSPQLPEAASPFQQWRSDSAGTQEQDERYAERKRRQEADLAGP